jgi:nucleotide-binding universal stress UspA family protein
VDILTLAEAIDMRAMYASTTLVSMRAPNLRLFQEAAARARGKGEQAVYLLFVDEIPGLFFPPKTGPSREAREVLATSADFFRRAGLTAVPVWRMAHDAGASIASAARKLGVEVVMVGTSQRSAVWHLLRGNVLESLIRDLPAEMRVWICKLRGPSRATSEPGLLPVVSLSCDRPLLLRRDRHVGGGAAAADAQQVAGLGVLLEDADGPLACWSPACGRSR